MFWKVLIKKYLFQHLSNIVFLPVVAIYEWVISVLYSKCRAQYYDY